jgi:DNA-damage-inducible protein J
MSNTIKIVQQHGLPFKVEYPQASKELMDAIEDAKRLEANPNTKCYTDMNEMWADLDK